jgi:hypothetical protein
VTHYVLGVTKATPINSLDSGCAEPRPGGPMKNKKVNNILLLLNIAFIHFQLQNNASICLQIPSKVKVTLGKSCCFLSVVLKYLQREKNGLLTRYPNN